MHCLKEAKRKVSLLLALLVAVTLMPNIDVSKIYASEDVVPATLNIDASKEVLDEKGEKVDPSNYDGEFSFELRDHDGNVIQTVSNSGSEIKFDEIAIGEAGTYTYTVSEVKGERTDIKYSQNELTFTVTAVETVVKGKTKIVLDAEGTELTETNSGEVSESYTTGGTMETGQVSSETLDGYPVIVTETGLIAYCLNEGEARPSDNGTDYVLSEENIGTGVWAYADQDGAAGSAGELESALKRIGYYGYPHDGSGEILNWIKSEYSMGDEEAAKLFQAATQEAVYYFIHKNGNDIFGETLTGGYLLNGKREAVARKILEYGDVPDTAKISLNVYVVAEGEVKRQNLLGFTVQEAIVNITGSEYGIGLETFVNELVSEEESPEESTEEPKEDEPINETEEVVSKEPLPINEDIQPTPEPELTVPEVPSTGGEEPVITKDNVPAPTPAIANETPEPQKKTEDKLTEVPGAPATPNTAADKAPTNAAPKTGDETNIGLYVLMMLAAGFAIIKVRKDVR